MSAPSGEGEGEQPQRPQLVPETVEDRTARNIGVGCFTTFVGFWSGGMVAVLIGRIVEGLRQSPSCDGLPICNWTSYALVGGVLGAVTLPVLVLRRLKRRDVRQ
jgi:uncharacterized membrane protein YdcZ (DUF606 family)